VHTSCLGFKAGFLYLQTSRQVSSRLSRIYQRDKRRKALTKPTESHTFIDTLKSAHIRRANKVLISPVSLPIFRCILDNVCCLSPLSYPSGPSPRHKQFLILSLGRVESLHALNVSVRPSVCLSVCLSQLEGFRLNFFHTKIRGTSFFFVF
jgi:hypothetical protein